MINEALPVIIHLVVGNEHSICIATITKEGPKYFAVPSLIAPAFSHFQKLELDEQRLELIPNSGGGRATYQYRGLVEVTP